MGIDIHALKFLMSAKAQGVTFERTVTIGRQRIYLQSQQLSDLLQPTATEVEDPYAEWIIRRLGGRLVDSVDISDYEKATILHDMNCPLPAHLRGMYTSVVEAGTLEHLFNFPVAIRNCMELVAPGGHLICCTVANNFCGHGFYQFSPELFYRVLSNDSGFAVERMIACDAFRESDWYDVLDPAEARCRVSIRGPYAVMLLVQARRVSEMQPLLTTPQQSDYVAVWTGEVDQHADHMSNTPRQPPTVMDTIRSLMPAVLFRRIRDLRSSWQYPAPLFRKHPPLKIEAR
jgi:hypothetical protein